MTSVKKTICQMCILSAAAVLMLAGCTAKERTPQADTILSEESDAGFPGMPSPLEVETYTNDILKGFQTENVQKLQGYQNPILTGESTSSFWRRSDAKSMLKLLCKDMVFQPVTEIDEKEYEQTKFGKPYRIKVDVLTKDETLFSNYFYSGLDGQTFSIVQLMEEKPEYARSAQDKLPYHHITSLQMYPSRDGRVYVNLTEALTALTGFIPSESVMQSSLDSESALVVSMLGASQDTQYHVGMDQIPDNLPMSVSDIQQLHSAFSERDIGKALELYESVCKECNVEPGSGWKKVSNLYNGLTEQEKSDLLKWETDYLQMNNVLLSATNEANSYAEFWEAGTIEDKEVSISGIQSQKTYVGHMQITQTTTKEEVFTQAEKCWDDSWMIQALRTFENK